VVPPGDPLPLARAIRVLLENPALRRHLGATARRRVAADYTHERMIERVLAVYGESLNR
jgi:glycosyltransferase involved in cell wall biosynthesis